MPLPEEIPVRYTEEDAGFVSVRPVVKQTFRLDELADMVVRVCGKEAPRVRTIFQSGTVVYNGYRYWWEGLTAELGEIEKLLLPFPEDNPSAILDPAKTTAVFFEIGGGAQRTVVEIQREKASRKKLFGSKTPWDAILELSRAFPPRYEKYSHAHQADLFRVSLPYEQSQQMLLAMLQAAPRSLRNRWSTLRPPAALIFICPR